METTRHVALLGGINVGGHRVTMDRLVTIVEALGHRNVDTFIASGNVLFDAPSDSDDIVLADSIAAALASALGYPVPTYVRARHELLDVAATLPFGPIPDGTTHMVAFCRAPLPATLELDHASGDLWRVHGRELHWFVPGTLSSSAITLAKLVRLLGQPATTRNHTMLRKLAPLL
ncbi:MAG: DUF1697 domain-containing protein [Actinomycetota bacterium]